MQVEAIYLNTAVGLNKLLHYCINIAKYYKNEQVVRDIIKEISCLPERRPELAFKVIEQKMVKLRTYLVPGKLPKNDRGPMIYDIITNGKKLKEILFKLGFLIDEDKLKLSEEKRYRFILATLQIIELWFWY